MWSETHPAQMFLPQWLGAVQGASCGCCHTGQPPAQHSLCATGLPDGLKGSDLAPTYPEVI